MILVEKSTTRDDAGIMMQEQGTLDKENTSDSQGSNINCAQRPRSVANEAKCDDIENLRNPGIFSNPANNGPSGMPKTPMDSSRQTMPLEKGGCTQASSLPLSQELPTSSGTTKATLQNHSYYGDIDTTEPSSIARIPALCNDLLKKTPADAEIWSEVRKRSLSQLQAHKSILLKALKVLKHSLSRTLECPVKIAEIQSLQKIVKQNTEIVKNAIFLLELGKEKASASHQPESQPSSQLRLSLIAELKNEKRRLTKELKAFEDEFAIQHGRPISSATDIEPQVHAYRRLQKLQGATAALRLEHDYRRHEKDQRQEICVQ
jgi:hypothetical protein